MTGKVPRVAFFPDSFHEVNGVAHTSRHFESFARNHDLPFLCVRAGSRGQAVEQKGNVWTLELPRGALSVPLEKDLGFDPAWLRHLPLIDETLERFAPDLIHVTGPSDVGLLGAALARRYDLPLAASWHTNVHEYAGRRFKHLLRGLPQTRSVGAAHTVERCAMAIASAFYSVAQVLFAPNPELCEELGNATGLPCYLMPRGVDSQLFCPGKRTRTGDDGERVLGYVGRLSVEKNVRLLAQIQRELELGRSGRFRFLIVGHGDEEAWLRRNLPGAEFAGVLKGEPLAAAYANMDLFVFPSHTDTFGNVVLEALASGVPAIVTQDGGPCRIVRDGVTGRIVADGDFASAIAGLMNNRSLHGAMRQAARAYAMSASWESVFKGVYAGYGSVLPGLQNGRTVRFRTAI
jgi:glycosyltransferase involved in cell wall biosynthesis